MRRYLVAAQATLTCLAIGTAYTVAVGRAWNAWLIPGLSVSAWVGGYVLWQTRPGKGATGN